MVDSDGGCCFFINEDNSKTWFFSCAESVDSVRCCGFLVHDDDDTMMLPPDRSKTCFLPMAENRGEDAFRSKLDDDDTYRSVLDDDDTMMLPPDRSKTRCSPMADDRGKDACRSGLGVVLDWFCFFWVLYDLVAVARGDLVNFKSS